MILQSRYKSGDIWHGPSIIISIIDVYERDDSMHVITMIIYSPNDKDPIRTVGAITKLSSGELNVSL